jgi:hypothetical protein
MPKTKALPWEQGFPYFQARRGGGMKVSEIGGWDGTKVRGSGIHEDEESATWAFETPMSVSFSIFSRWIFGAAVSIWNWHQLAEK